MEHIKKKRGYGLLQSQHIGFFISCEISKMKQRTESTKYIAIKPAQLTWPNVLIAKIHKTSKIIAWLK